MYMSTKRTSRKDEPVVAPFPQRLHGTSANGTGCNAMRMLHAEQQSLIELLHDDLGQNLVAIRSFSAAIAERYADDGGDTAELATMINEAAEAAYRRSYDLMQELRAQQSADEDLATAVGECLREARLQERDIVALYRIDAEIDELDRATRALVLRNVRGFANLCKSLGDCERVSITLQPALGKSDRLLQLALGYAGSFEQLDNDHPSLKSLAERTSAIGGEILLGCDSRGGEFTLDLFFDPLFADCAKTS